MALLHAQPGTVVDVRPLGDRLSETKTTTLIKTDCMEVLRMVMLKGKEISEHRAPGEITVQCLEGKVAFTALGETRELQAGQLLYLPAKEPHSVKALDDASFLLTILLHQ